MPESNQIAAIPIIAYLLNVCCGCCTDSTKYICNKMELPECMRNIETAIKNPPKMTMHIKNYHYETHTTTDDKGNTRTEKRKVYTHSASEPFHFSEWVDKSPPPENLNYIEVIHLTRLFTHKIINMSARAEGSYQVQKHNFIKENWRDDHYDYNFSEEIEGHNAHSLVVNPERGGYPWYTSTPSLVFCDLFLFGYIPRYLLDKNSLIVEFTIEKYIYG